MKDEYSQACNYFNQPINRRSMLRNMACGFGYLAFAGIQAKALARNIGSNPLATKPPHFAPKAKRVIYMLMHGGFSHVDTFDYKPELQRYSGSPFPYEVPLELDGNETQWETPLLGSPWKFKQHGQSGLWVSNLFPEIAKHADDICVLKGMHTEGQGHGEAMLNWYTGKSTEIRPSIGSWVTYGLGTANENLPGFVTLAPTRAHGGVQLYGSAFLPAAYQGTPIGTQDTHFKTAQIHNLRNEKLSRKMQEKQLELIQMLDKEHLKRSERDQMIEGSIQANELAFRMQMEAPPLMDLSKESPATLKMYGIGEKETDDYGRQFLQARKFAEAGVRFIQVSTSYKWDAHGKLWMGHNKIARQVDKPVAGLLKDLKLRGMLDDTLLVFGTEFGRTPYAESSDGRDHNPSGFTIWLAGGGVRGGMTYGGTDEFGFRAVEGRMHFNDLHATILYLLGLDHERLTYSFSGRDYRLTDLGGNVATEILA